MPAPAVRRFMLADAMILVAATAMGIAWTRAYVMGIQPFQFSASFHGNGMSFLLRFWIPVAVPCLAMWSVAAFILAFSRPRPVLRRLAHQPGFVACGMATLVSATRVVPTLLGWVVSEIMDWP